MRTAIRRTITTLINITNKNTHTNLRNNTMTTTIGIVITNSNNNNKKH